MPSITICPFCLCLRIFDYDVGDECPDCEIGILEDFEEYNERIKKLNEDSDNDRKDSS